MRRRVKSIELSQAYCKDKVCTDTDDDDGNVCVCVCVKRINYESREKRIKKHVFDNNRPHSVVARI